MIQYLGAGSLMAIASGTGTVSKTGCKKGSFLLLDVIERGAAVAGDFSGPSNVTNVTRIDASGNFFTSIPEASNEGIGIAGASQRFIYCGRAIADGTCSADLTVGASGNDLYAILYEFCNVSASQALGGLFETAVGAQFGGEANNNTNILDADVAVSGKDRYALQFVAVEGVQSLAPFTGETGGDWEELAENSSAAGLGVTMQLQGARISQGTIGGGSQTITSAPWGVTGTALIPRYDLEPVIDLSEYPKEKLRSTA